MFWCQRRGALGRDELFLGIERRQEGRDGMFFGAERRRLGRATPARGTERRQWNADLSRVQFLGTVSGKGVQPRMDTNEHGWRLEIYPADELLLSRPAGTLSCTACGGRGRGGASNGARLC